VASLLRLVELLRIAEQEHLLAARDAAIAFASETCPASSTKSTSTDAAMSSRAQSHAVPPTTSASRSTSMRSASSLLGIGVMPQFVASPSGTFCATRTTVFAFSATRVTAQSRFSITV
jgi:hypothetical protein